MTLIRTKNISRSFSAPGGDLNILKDINFEIEAGEMTAIMGPSGAGKSTLLHILGALDRPTAGSLFYEENDIFSLSNDELALFRNRQVGFVFQFHHLLPEFNTLENTIMPALIAGTGDEEARSKAEGILNELGLSSRLLHRPGELSGGEQQRVAVARALILEPKVVLADEPTGNLDTQTGEELFGLLADLNKKGLTFIMVTHNESLASRCGRVIYMKDGSIV